MKQKVYLDPNGGRHHSLPGILNNTSPITEAFALSQGWTVVEEDVPEPGLPESLLSKERAFASTLMQEAITLNVDLLSLPEVNIASLKAAAVAAGATDEAIGKAATELMALCFDIQAESGATWAETWQGLKSRLPEHFAAIQQQGE